MVYNVVISYNIWFIIYNYNDGYIYIYGFHGGFHDFGGGYLVAHPTNRKWLITPIISGLTLLIPLITGVITH